MRKLRTMIAVASTILTAGGLVGGGYYAGSAVITEQVQGSMNGYNVTGQGICNFFSGSIGIAVDPKSERVTSYKRSDLYAADLACTTAAIESFNRAAAKAGMRERVCRFDAIGVSTLIDEDEPMSCASIAKER